MYRFVVFDHDENDGGDDDDGDDRCDDNDAV